jgi:hypothetical protein
VLSPHLEILPNVAVHLPVNSLTCLVVRRGLVGMLLPLQGGGSVHSSQAMADLATFVTPEPALRFAELWSSDPGAAGTRTGVHELVQQLSCSIPRYSSTGATIKTGCSLVVARGQLHERDSSNRGCVHIPCTQHSDPPLIYRVDHWLNAGIARGAVLLK